MEQDEHAHASDGAGDNGEPGAKRVGDETEEGGRAQEQIGTKDAEANEEVAIGPGEGRGCLFVAVQGPLFTAGGESESAVAP